VSVRPVLQWNLQAQPLGQRAIYPSVVIEESCKNSMLVCNIKIVIHIFQNIQPKRFSALLAV